MRYPRNILNKAPMFNYSITFHLYNGLSKDYLF